jgi:hypothetical protein
VFAIVKEKVHVAKEGHHESQVKEAKDHEAPVEKQGTLLIDSFNHSAIVEEMHDES